MKLFNSPRIVAVLLAVVVALGSLESSASSPPAPPPDHSATPDEHSAPVEPHAPSNDTHGSPGDAPHSSGHHEDPACEAIPHLRSKVFAVSIFASILLIFALIIEFVLDKFDSCWGAKKQIMKILQAIYRGAPGDQETRAGNAAGKLADLKTPSLLAIFADCRHLLDHISALFAPIGYIPAFSQDIELMIMGMIAFFLFAIEHIDDAVDPALLSKFNQFLQLPDCPEAAYQVFEKVHMAVFGIVILYLITCLYLILLHVLVYRSWNKVEHLRAETAEALWRAEITRRSRMSCLAKAFNCCSAIRYHRRSTDRDYHLLRSSLITQHMLPKKYPFSLYMKYGMREVVVELVEVHPITWLLVLALIWVNYGRSAIPFSHFSNGNTVEIGVFGMAMFVTLVFAGVTLKARHIYRRLLELSSIAKPQPIKSLLSARQATGGAGELAPLSDLTVLPGFNAADEYEASRAFRNWKKELKRVGAAHFHGKTEHHKLFWFSRPTLLLRFVQLLLFLTSSLLGVAVYFVYSWTREAPNSDDDIAPPDSPGYYILPFIPPLLSFGILIPSMLILFVKIMYTGDLVKPDLVVKAHNKHELVISRKKAKGIAVDEDDADEDGLGRPAGYDAEDATAMSTNAHSDDKTPLI